MPQDRARRRAGWERERRRAGLGDNEGKGCRKSAATVLVLLAGAASLTVYGAVHAISALLS
jgi:hypothetical protein